MRREDFNFPSADRETEIHSVRWIPDGEIHAILQIAHGMVEHIERYAPFAEYLTEQGILVTGNDHLGHGRSIADADRLAHFPKGGNSILLRDMHTLRINTEQKYPGIPYFMMGHSMGSFLVRQYICMRGEGLSGAVIMGTGDQPKAMLGTAYRLAAAKARVQGPMHHSKMITKMAFGSYLKRIKDADSPQAWLSVNEANVEAYDQDPLCGMLFTNQAFAEMFYSMLYLKERKYLERIPQTLPILLVAGEEDPVGDYGKAVRKVEQEYRDLELTDVTCILYEGRRHEILNETQPEVVYEDILGWIEERRTIHGM